MTRSARPARRTLALTAAAGFLGSGLLSWQLASPERGLEGSFRQALEQGSTLVLKTATAAPLPSPTFGAGLWFSGLASRVPGEDAQPMEVGSHVTILAREGEARRLEVVDVRPVSGHVQDLDSSLPPAMALVTLRPVGQTSGGEVRILVETGSPSRPGANAARTL